VGAEEDEDEDEFDDDESYEFDEDDELPEPTSFLDDLNSFANTLIEAAEVLLPLVLRGIEFAETVQKPSWARWPWTIVQTGEVRPQPVRTEVPTIVEDATPSPESLAVAPEDERHSMSSDEASP